jgi:hypothetical protein
MHDRIAGNALPFTHDLPADLLVVNRTTVSLAAAALNRGGVIENSRSPNSARICSAEMSARSARSESKQRNRTSLRTKARLSGNFPSSRIFHTECGARRCCFDNPRHARGMNTLRAHSQRAASRNFLSADMPSVTLQHRRSHLFAVPQKGKAVGPAAQALLSIFASPSCP